MKAKLDQLISQYQSQVINWRQEGLEVSWEWMYHLTRLIELAVSQQTPKRQFLELAYIKSRAFPGIYHPDALRAHLHRSLENNDHATAAAMIMKLWEQGEPI